MLYKLLFLAAMVPSVALCSNNPLHDDFTGRITKEKKISKKFNVSPNSLLQVNNSYGNVDITTWDQNTISIEVFIKTNGNDEEKVKAKLDDIKVEFNQTPDGVKAKTVFSKEESSWWNSLFGSNSNVNMEINYVIKAPVTNNVEVNNDYGNVFLDKLTGNAKISCDYGRIDIGELHGNNNYLSFDYSRNSHFGYINKAVISADYSEFTVDDAKSLELKADYTDSKMKKIELLQFSCDYGSLVVEKVRKIAGSGDYLSTRIGQIFQAANLNLDYGNIVIAEVVKGAEEIKIDSDYTGVKIGYNKEHPFRFSVNTNYGNVKGTDKFEVNKRNEGNSSSSYAGYHLNNTGNGNIIVSSNYAGVTFQEK